MSNFEPVVEIPESPESCAVLVDPLGVEINRKVQELIGQRDCIDFSTNLVCTELDATTAQTISDNRHKLSEKAAAIVAKLESLAPVIG